MQIEIYYIIYLILFRLMIITAGIVSIFLGYRLFIHGITEVNKDSSLDSSFNGMSFKLQNVAPGTFFAIFGVIIISVMLASNPPQFESTESGNSNSVAEDNIAQATTRTIKMRAGDNEITELLEEGMKKEKEGNKIEAFSAYKQALNLAEKQFRLSELFNLLAWQYYQANQSTEEALHLSQMANDISPMNENYIDTLVDILVKLDRKDAAIQILEKSIIRIEPKAR